MNKSILLLAQSLRLFLALAVATLGLSGLAFAGTDTDQPAALKKEYSAKVNQLKEASNASAALRKSKGLGRSTTGDDRTAAAQRNAARKAAAAKLKGGQP